MNEASSHRKQLREDEQDGSGKPKYKMQVKGSQMNFWCVWWTSGIFETEFLIL